VREQGGGSRAREQTNVQPHPPPIMIIASSPLVLPLAPFSHLCWQGLQSGIFSQEHFDEFLSAILASPDVTLTRDQVEADAQAQAVEDDATLQQQQHATTDAADDAQEESDADSDL
jgi:hypothetical protein